MRRWCKESATDSATTYEYSYQIGVLGRTCFGTKKSLLSTFWQKQMYDGIENGMTFNERIRQIRQLTSNGYHTKTIVLQQEQTHIYTLSSSDR